MKITYWQRAVLSFALFSCAVDNAFGAMPLPSIDKAKQEAEARGYVFLDSHEKIVAAAKKEAKMRALSGLDADTIKAMVGAFRKKYPFLDVRVEEIEGTDAYQRFILQMQAGSVRDWDATFIPIDFYKDYQPFQKKIDLLGMVRSGILKIHPEMIHPVDRNVIGSSSILQVVAYNRKLLGDAKTPDSWEDFLKPEFKGRKFVVDVRPLSVANLVPAWGLEKTLDFARKIAEQKPVWVRGSRTLASMALGEYSLFMGLNVSSVLEAQAKDLNKSLELQFLEPVPVRFGAADGVFSTAVHPHAALLWMEFQVSTEGQEILDKYGPADGSVYVAGSQLHTMIRGRPLSSLTWDLQKNLDQWVKRIVEAYGFPSAEKGT